MRKIYNRKCEFCQLPFHTCDSEMLCCNSECTFRQKTMRELLPWEDNPKIKEPPILKKQCQHCGYTYEKFSKGEPYNYGRKYCDPACNIARTIYKKKNWTKSCACCGNDISRISRTKTCSDACAFTLKQEKNTEQRLENRQKAIDNPVEKKKRKAVSYAELNRRAEVKRLEEDWKRLVKGKR